MRDEDEFIDLKELIRTLWSGKWVIGSTMLVFGAVSLVVALMLPNMYRAEALLSPYGIGTSGGSFSTASQYNNLASLAGFNLNADRGGKTDLGIETLKSRKFVSEFVESHDLLVPLVAASGWDAETNKLIIDDGVFEVSTGKWTRDVSPPKRPEPSLQEAYDRFMNIFDVRRNDATGFVTISIEHYSPYVAKQWVDWLTEDVNSSIMRQDVAEANQAIQYLQKQIQSTSLADLHAVFFSLIEEQTKTVMLAEVSEEYLFKTLDPAIVPEKKSSPKRLMIILLSTLFGVFIGVLVVAFRAMQ